MTRKLALLALALLWLAHLGGQFHTSYNSPRLESRLRLSERLGLAGLYADGPLEALRPILLQLALSVESDPKRLEILRGQGGPVAGVRDLSAGFREAAVYQNTPTPDRLPSLKAMAYQGLQRLGTTVFLLLIWSAGALALTSQAAPTAEPPERGSLPAELGLGVVFSWTLLIAYIVGPVLRHSLAGTSPWTNFWVLQSASAATLLLLLYLFRGRPGYSFGSPSAREVGRGLLLCAAAILTTELAIIAVSGVSPFARNPTLDVLLQASGVHLLGFVILAVVLGPLLEELLFRGRLLASLESTFSPQIALLVSSAVFALAHGSFWNAPGQFVGGLILGRSVQRTGSVATSVAIHGGWNLFWLIRVYASC